MEHLRRLGRTALEVSRLSLGTVELGLDYGIEAPGEFGQPRRDEAIDLLRQARDRGVRLFDTAPTYGASEELLGVALGDDEDDCTIATTIATKVGPFDAGMLGSDAAIAETVRRSVASSRHRLGRGRLDLVQIHNATPQSLAGGVLDTLRALREAGELRYVGASVYGEDAALAAIDCGGIDVLQIAVNLLDRRALARVVPAAREHGVGLIARSVFLKGVLTPKAEHLPARLSALREAADAVRRAFSAGWSDLPSLALRYCLSLDAIDTVLVGVRTLAELDAALAAVAAGPLDAAELARLPATECDPRLLDPSTWDLP